MPRVFDNIDLSLLPALNETLELSHAADFCVGYLNLRGWKSINRKIDSWEGGDGAQCRILVGMQRLPHQDMKELLRLGGSPNGVDNQQAIQLRKKAAEEFREQLVLGAPTNQDENGLKRLAALLKSKKVKVKLYLRHTLHAKLYLLYRNDPVNPIVGYLGSSNLTFSGLSGQGELNVDVLDHDAAEKLSKWFEARWNDRFCIDISDELVEIIQSSWAGERQPTPYEIYIKIAYHLSREARSGIAEYTLPRDLSNQLFEFQEAAVKIAAHHLRKRGGVVIGDVVGLGKTLMATALLRLFEDLEGPSLIICPRNLVSMWEDYRTRYGLAGRVISISRVQSELPDLRRYRVVLIDESHNLRNRNGKRYRAIEEYIRANDSKCILLSATPYNKSYLDLANQLRLFQEEEADIGIRPETYLREIGETEFVRRHQCPLRSLAAFEKSEHADDWRELMRLYLVRRTRTFIQDNYASKDENGRTYLEFSDGSRSYFPNRLPKTVSVQDNLEDSQYSILYSQEIVDRINSLSLPRYGLGNYELPHSESSPSAADARHLQDLSRAGKRLMGFCRTNLFKRLESCGYSFIQSIERHILRNRVFIYAIENGLPLPLGTQHAEMLDTRLVDDEVDFFNSSFDEEAEVEEILNGERFDEEAKATYEIYSQKYKNRFNWISPEYFSEDLTADLKSDSDILAGIVNLCGKWSASKDGKLQALHQLITSKHKKEKVLVFTQFADTVRYLHAELLKVGVSNIAQITGGSSNPTETVWRFSPESNGKSEKVNSSDEIRVLITTDVLSEGQNLQDASVVVNFDLPWAIVRLIQRAGRVDRIGQKSEEILCYSFLPAEGVERIINLRGRVRQRLIENAEVVGTDEAFFEDDSDATVIQDLYSEKAGVLDQEDDVEVDLASRALQIWNSAIAKNPKLANYIPALPDVSYSSRKLELPDTPPGVVTYVRTADDYDALAYLDVEGTSITESQFEILTLSACSPTTPTIQKHERHHELVGIGAKLLTKEGKKLGGQLGRPTGARFRTYERLKAYEREYGDTLFMTAALKRAIDQIYNYPLKQVAVDVLNLQLRGGVDDNALADVVLSLWEEDRLCQIESQEKEAEPQIICSLGIWDE